MSLMPRTTANSCDDLFHDPSPRLYTAAACIKGNFSGNYAPDSNHKFESLRRDDDLWTRTEFTVAPFWQLDSNASMTEGGAIQLSADSVGRFESSRTEIILVRWMSFASCSCSSTNASITVVEHPSWTRRRQTDAVVHACGKQNVTYSKTTGPTAEVGGLHITATLLWR